MSPTLIAERAIAAARQLQDHASGENRLLHPDDALANVAELLAELAIEFARLAEPTA